MPLKFHHLTVKADASVRGANTKPAACSLFIHVAIIVILGYLSIYVVPANSQNITIIESESYNSGHVMDLVWQNTANSLGMNAVISPQSTLYDTTFFSGTDALIVSSGVITLLPSQINTISKFMESGRSLYLQGEYSCPSYNTNTTFESLVNDNGGFFTLNGTISGDLNPMMVLGSLATTPNAVSPLSYFWYGCRGTPCTAVEPFLQYGNDYFGFIFCPPNENYGRVVMTTDQDWVNQSTSIALVKNILSLITSSTYQCSVSSFFSLDLGADTTICTDSTLVLNGGPANYSHLWSTGATSQNITIDAAGTYWLTLSNGTCSVSDTIIVTEVPCGVTAVAFHAADTVLCEKFCTGFFDNSANNPTAWLWTFEGGSPATSTQQNPANVCYDLPGVYDVTLITTGSGGSDTLTLPGYITVHPTPDFPVITQNGNVLTSTPSAFYQWQLNAMDIPGATNQSYTITQSGLYTVYVFDLNGCKNSATGNYLVTGIEETAQSWNFSMYPNPSAGYFFVDISGLINNKVLIVISNMLGQVLFSTVQRPVNGSLKSTIDLTGTVPGIYVIEISSGAESVRQKILITH